MAVVPVHAPGLQHAGGEVIVPWAPDVVHDAVVSPSVEGSADAAGDILQRFLPRGADELPGAARPGTAQRVEDALGIADLVEGRRPLGADAPATARVHRVALEAHDRARGLVHAGEQSAGRFTVETDGGDALEMALPLLGPGGRVPFHPVVPLLGRRSDGELPRRLTRRLGTRRGWPRGRGPMRRWRWDLGPARRWPLRPGTRPALLLALRHRRSSVFS